MDQLISGNRLMRIGRADDMKERKTKRILVVDDSITVREVERKMLTSRGYEVDVFFSSIAQFWPGKGIAALLTGMGRDGAEGLLALHNRNWYTIAQDRDSSIVYGMPKAAVQLGAATDILPAGKIGKAISNYILANQSKR
ncbi:MAG: chemotaxis protein CheB [Thermodesulfobacteriota bacterium]